MVALREPRIIQLLRLERGRLQTHPCAGVPDIRPVLTPRYRGRVAESPGDRRSTLGGLLHFSFPVPGRFWIMKYISRSMPSHGTWESRVTPHVTRSRTGVIR